MENNLEELLVSVSDVISNFSEDEMSFKKSPKKWSRKKS